MLRRELLRLTKGLASENTSCTGRGGGGCWLNAPQKMTGPEDKDLFGVVARDPHGSLLGDEFIVPPFSVLNAREGWWQERKRKWLALGIQSELGRGQQLIPNAGGGF